MTAKEIYNHNWFVGEKIWAIVHKYPKLSYLREDRNCDIPIEVKELTVTKYKKATYCGTTFVILEFDLPSNIYTYMDNIASVNKEEYGIKCNVNEPESYACKFFTKEEAEKQFPIKQKKCLAHYKEIIKEKNSEKREHLAQIKRLEKQTTKLNDTVKELQELFKK